MPIAGPVVADANVLLSALAQKAAAKVLSHDLEIYTTAFTWGEVEEYLPHMGQRYNIPDFLLRRALSVLPVIVKSRAFYRQRMTEAKNRMRDPEDVDLSALALHLNAPVWTNDNDFKDVGWKMYTTAQLLKALEG